MKQYKRQICLWVSYKLQMFWMKFTTIFRRQNRISTRFKTLKLHPLKYSNWDIFPIPKKSIYFPRIIYAHEEIWKLERAMVQFSIHIIHLCIKIHEQLSSQHRSGFFFGDAARRKLKSWFIAMHVPNGFTADSLSLFQTYLLAELSPFSIMHLQSFPREIFNETNNPSKIH